MVVDADLEVNPIQGAAPLEDGQSGVVGGIRLQRRHCERPDLVGHLSIGRPSSIENVRDAVTAGVLLEFEGHYVFQAGLNGPGDALGIVRLGGHLEPGETAEDCARREVREEGNADASLVAADSTWSYEPATASSSRLMRVRRRIRRHCWSRRWLQIGA